MRLPCDNSPYQLSRNFTNNEQRRSQGFFSANHNILEHVLQETFEAAYNNSTPQELPNLGINAEKLENIQYEEDIPKNYLCS